MGKDGVVAYDDDARARIKREVVEHLIGGGSLLEFCEREGMPNRGTIYEWRDSDPDFGQQFARARAAGADALVDLAQRVADDGTNDYVERETKKGTFVMLDAEHVQRSKLRVDVLLKRAACFAPATYGTKAQVEHGGGLSLTVVTGVPDPDPDPPEDDPEDDVEGTVASD